MKLQNGRELLDEGAATSFVGSKIVSTFLASMSLVTIRINNWLLSSSFSSCELEAILSKVCTYGEKQYPRRTVEPIAVKPAVPRTARMNVSNDNNDEL